MRRTAPQAAGGSEAWRGARDGVEVQSEPSAESLALFCRRIFSDFDHTGEMAGAQKLLSCACSPACAVSDMFNLALNTVDILTAS